MNGTQRGVSGRLFRLALRAFPPRFAAHADEMAATFGEEHARERRERGAGAALGYALRASWDAARQGLSERLRTTPPPGHGAPAPPPGPRPWSGLAADLRHASRSLRATPGFTATAIAVLALGIGANTTVFSALRIVILSPAPYPEPDRLVFADLTQEHIARAETRTTRWSHPKLRAFLEVPDRHIDPVAAYVDRVATLSGVGPAARIDIEVVSPTYFGLLGLSPVMGRLFRPDEDDAASPPLVAVISHAMWRGRFAGDPNVVGREITLSGSRFEVVGVGPDGFRGLTGRAELWVPLVAVDQAIGAPRWLDAGGNHWLHVLGRLTPESTMEQARAQLSSVGTALAAAYPSNDPQTVWSADARPFNDVRVNPGARSAVILLGVGALLVLLAACANLSGLLLARARRAARVAAVRMAMGASRWRIIRASLIESLVLAALGGSAGVGLAYLGTGAMRAAWPSSFVASARSELQVTDVSRLGLEPGVLAFALVVTLLTTLVVGGAPALRASGTRVSATLKEGAGVGRRDRTRLGFDARSALVGTQTALALVLLVGAGLVGTSIARLMDVDQGFRVEGTLSFRYALPNTSAWSERRDQFHDLILDRLLALPGVESAATGTRPLGGRWAMTRIDEVEGGLPIPPDEGTMIGVHAVSDTYFEALGVPVVRGRTFDTRDGTDSSPAVVLSATAARVLFGGEDPIGKGIVVGFADPNLDRLSVVVGVVGDVRYGPPDEETMPETYYSYRDLGTIGSTVLARTSGDPAAVVPAIRALAAELDPSLALYGVTTMEDALTASVGDRRVVLALLQLFALVAVLLAATGTWGIVAVSVAERRRELGLRMALGAGGDRVVRLVLSRSMRAAVAGVALGLVGSVAVSGLLEAFLWRTRATDPVVFAAGATLLVAVAFLASWIPARRVLAVDPAETLRAE